MKVLYVLSGTDLYGGSTKAFYNLFKEVKLKGVEPLVFCTQKNGIYNILKEEGVSVEASDFRFTSWPGYRGGDLLFFVPRLLFRIYLHTVAYYKLLQFAKINKPDIIHSNVSVIDIGYLVARKLHIRHIWHVREYGLLDFNIHVAPSYSIFKKRLNDKINHSICITKGIQIYHGLSDINSTVIYDGVMSQKMIRYNPVKGNYFLFVGRLEKTKGADVCIDAFKKLVDEQGTESELRIAGAPIKDEYLDYLKSQAKGYRISFLGARKDVYDLMYNAKALIVPSKNEGFGFITAEAMFNGCLVIGRNTSGTKEQMDNGLEKTGNEIALRFETEAELVMRMKEVDNLNSAVFREMVMRGLAVASDLYSTEKHAARVASLYKRIVDETEK